MTKRLFLDSPKELERRIDRLVGHFRHAEYLFLSSRPAGLPTPRDLVWLLIVDAVTTARSMPDKERAMVSRVGSAIPTPADSFAVKWEQAMERVKAGLPQWEPVKVRCTVHESDVDRMVDVLDLFRFVVGGRGGKDAKRLKNTVMARAAGLTIEQCGRVWDKHRLDFDRRAFWDIKSRVIGQILKGLDQEFGLVRTSRSFRRLTLRELEVRKKAKGRMRVEMGEAA